MKKELVVIDYTNHRRDRRKRTIHPREIIFTATDWHPLGWVLKAWDVDSRAYRLFAMKDIHSWEEKPPP